MRVDVDIRPRPDGGHDLVAAVGDGEAYTQEVCWLADKRLLVAAKAADSVDNPVGLARAMEHCDADGDEARQLKCLEQYGRLLFEAAFGKDTWQAILRTATAEGEEYLQVAVHGSAGDDHAALQALRWEALHDGTRFIAAQGTTDAAIEVGVIRLIKPTAATTFQRIEHIPRVLFAVGSHLSDRSIRPGAEFMGIMRSLDRSGVQARVLASATRESLLTALKTFKPDVLHFIGHGKRDKGEVRVQLRPGPGDEGSGVSARELLGIFELVKYRPTMVLLSVCHTADATGTRDPGEPAVSALPFAARLVAGDGVTAGVPVVVAMAGDISDTACRVFTRAMAAVIGEGEPLGKAVIQGRRATFFGGPGAATQHPVPESGHWVMPALFLAEGVVPDNARLVNTARTEAAQKRVLKLGMKQKPIFCGRADFIDALDRLLDADDDLNVLGARAPGPNFGGRRLLKELGARAVRSGVLPVLLDFPSAAFSPKDLVGLTTRLQECLDDMRASVPGFRNGPRPTRALDVATNERSHKDVAAAIRADFAALVEDLDDDDPVKHRAEGQPRTMLLCHRIDEWGAFTDLVDLLGPNGLQMGETPVPVVFTAADGPELRDEERFWSGGTWMEVWPLDRFSKNSDEADEEMDEALRDEDILAYLWWLLNPEKRNERVYALLRSANPDWPAIIRLYLEKANAPIYPRDELRPMARRMEFHFRPGNDDDLLARYASAR
jgi:CHAT domain